jgi:hypothetical protein
MLGQHGLMALKYEGYFLVKIKKVERIAQKSQNCPLFWDTLYIEMEEKYQNYLANSLGL